MLTTPHRLSGPFRRDWCSRDLDYWGKTVVEDFRALVVAALIGVLGLPVVPRSPTKHVMRRLDHGAVCVS